ncbi:MAG: sugar phosphate isomerase/epimerase family protein [Saprospiraceae bacterium]|nr:sugar phosphate isomerase/epimerase family protein [Saprospiraceae bacterium]
MRAYNLIKAIILFSGSIALAASLWACTNTAPSSDADSDPATNGAKISLAQWSLHNALQNGEIDNLDFARIAADSAGIYQLEYVSQFFQDKAEDFSYLQQMKDSCAKYGVESLLIMVDDEGELGDTSETKRRAAVQNHHKWIDAAKFLGCYGIRVNANGLGDYGEVQQAVVKSLRELAAYAKEANMAVVVENHGITMPDGEWNENAFSTNGQRLATTLAMVDRPNIGALPDFGNFYEYDKYEGVKELMPYAMGVSAKTSDFNEQGEAINTDFGRMFDIIRSFNFDGYVGVEYEEPEDYDNGLTEYEGIRLTKALIEKYY